MTKHTRNVAGYQLQKVTNAVYKQIFGDGTYRLFVRLRKQGQRNQFVWRYTRVGDDETSPDEWSLQSYPTLTAAVMAVNN